MAKAAIGNLTVGGIDYVIVPKADYLKLVGRADVDSVPKGSVDAHAFVRSSIAADLRAARESAKLTQAQLAERMGKSQTMVSQAEAGHSRVSERYVRVVLKACGLPMDWSGTKKKRARKSR